MSHIAFFPKVPKTCLSHGWKLTATERLQATIADFPDRSAKMGLSLTPHKCGVLHLGSRNPGTEYEMNGIVMRKMYVLKDPGVRFLASMNFAEHVIHVCSSIVISLDDLQLDIAKPVHENAYLKVCESLVVPIVLRASQVWCSSKVCDLEILEKMQRRFVKKGRKPLQFNERVSETVRN